MAPVSVALGVRIFLVGHTVEGAAGSEKPYRCKQIGDSEAQIEVGPMQGIERKMKWGCVNTDSAPR